MGLEPILSAWKAEDLPLIHIRRTTSTPEYALLMRVSTDRGKRRPPQWRGVVFTASFQKKWLQVGRITGIEPVSPESQSDTLTN